MILKVRVTPNAKRFEIRFENGLLKARVRAPPEGGRANEELARELSKILGKKAFIVKGLKSREKEVLVAGLSEEEITKKLY
ncbi:DUF167 domain-containing protein [Candidatus Micrarchaeota archaeon]|nr:DUF167 domain-containing protein [Candidatus Micrarchaeota archaeon]